MTQITAHCRRCNLPAEMTVAYTADHATLIAHCHGRTFTRREKRRDLALVVLFEFGDQS